MAVVGCAEPVVARFHKSLQNVAKEQENVLESMLRKESGCEYLRRHGFEGQVDVHSFRQLLPVIEYDVIEEDMRRIMEGDRSPILTCDEVIALYASSGTSSGKRKILPVTPSRRASLQLTWGIISAFRQLSPAGTAAAQGLKLLLATVGKTSHSPAGLPIASLSTFFYRNTESVNWSCGISSPVEVVHCDDYRQSTYCHLLCGLLRAGDVTNFSSAVASGLATGFSFLSQLWREMCRDIETGDLNGLVTDPAARAAVTKLLSRPNKELADLVRAECGKECWRGILLRLWPQAKYIDCIATGSMVQYVDYFNFLSDGQLPIISGAYSGSEGFYGVNPCPMNSPDDTFYVMLPNSSIYFEFMRHHQEDVTGVDTGRQATTLAPVVGLAGVQEGEDYELIVTNGEGLWRYNVGDVVQCVGFYHEAPKFKVVGRKNVVLSVHTEKTEEKELWEAVSKAADSHLASVNARLHDFTSCASLESVPGHYVIFWEISSATGNGAAAHTLVGDTALADACFTMETALGEPYRRGRISGTIDPLELRVVRPGTFDQIKQAAIDGGVSPSQFKTTRAYMAGSPALAILNAAVLESSRSPRSPPHAILNPV